MRVSLIEGICLVAIGATVVELHDSHRFARTGAPSEPARLTAAKPAAVADEVRVRDAPSVMAGPRYR